MSWEPAAREYRDALANAIPQKWLLQDDQKATLKDVREVPTTCGLLSKEQLIITESTASRLVGQLARGELSASSVVEAFCGRAAIAHQLVNCLTVFFPEQALKRAAELDEYLERTGKTAGPLHGLPIALKDTFDIPGYPTTWGFAANAAHRAERESAIVEVLREAGAVFYTKTTMPQTGMLLETVSNLFGRTLNPFNPEFGSGGSSGGDGALVAMKGSPMTPSTDIGGSIRAPAAFNGLYGIRPSADRIPKRAMKSVESGQLNIRVSCGPVCHGMADLKLMTRTLTSWPQARYDTTCVPTEWREVDKSTAKLAFGLWEFDGAVMPHPPILRAMRLAAERLKAQGHEGSPLTAGRRPKSIDTLALLEKAGETMMPAAKKMCEIYNIKEDSITAREVVRLVQAQTRYEEALCDAWEATKDQTSNGSAIAGIICPVSSTAGYPHDFLPWWGYTSLFNLVDYPSIVLPVKDMKINPIDDPKNASYAPQKNPFDGPNHEIYDPKRWANQPVTIQIVARPFDDEELIAVTEVVDHVVNGMYMQ